MGREKVELLKSKHKIGTTMLKKDYLKISNFILNAINDADNGGILLIDLITLAQEELDQDFYGDVSWYLLQVKQDLELRKKIKKEFVSVHQQFIRIVKPRVQKRVYRRKS